MQANGLLTSQEMVSRFITLVKSVNSVDDDGAESILQSECDFFIAKLTSDMRLANSTYESILGVFMDVIKSGLTFSPSQNLVYVQSRMAETPQGKVSKLLFNLSPDGEIYIRQCVGSIAYVLDPQIVYHGDYFVEYHQQGKKFFDHSPQYQSDVIHAAFTYVVMPDGSREGFCMNIKNDIARLAQYSANNSGGKVNSLYTKGPNGQIDAGFLKGKVKKFAVKPFRRKQLASIHLDETIE